MMIGEGVEEAAAPVKETHLSPRPEKSSSQAARTDRRPAFNPFRPHDACLAWLGDERKPLGYTRDACMGSV
jgi:hypothetical protein